MYDAQIRRAATIGTFCIATSILLGALKFIIHPSVIFAVYSLFITSTFATMFVLHIRGFIFLGKKYRSSYLILAARYFVCVAILYWTLQIADLTLAYFVSQYRTPGFVISLFLAIGSAYLLGGCLVGVAIGTIRRSIGRLAWPYVAMGAIWAVYLVYTLSVPFTNTLTLIGSIPILEVAVITAGSILLYGTS